MISTRFLRVLHCGCYFSIFSDSRKERRCKSGRKKEATQDNKTEQEADRYKHEIGGQEAKGYETRHSFVEAEQEILRKESQSLRQESEKAVVSNRVDKGPHSNPGMCTSLPINIEFDPSTNSLMAYTERTIGAIAGRDKTIIERTYYDFAEGSERFKPLYSVRELVHMPKVMQVIDGETEIKELEKKLNKKYGNNLFDDAKIDLKRSEIYAGLNVLLDEMVASISQLKSMGYKRDAQKIKAYDYNEVAKDLTKFINRAETNFPTIADWLYIYEMPPKTYGAYKSVIAHLSTICKTFRKIAESNDDIAILRVRNAKVVQSHIEEQEKFIEGRNREYDIIKNQNENLMSINEKFKAELSEMRDRLTHMETDLENLSSENSTLKKIISTQKKNLKEFSRTYTNLERLLKKKTEENAVLEKKIRDLEVTVSNQKTELIQLTGKYKRRGNFLTWRDDPTGELCERTYSDEFLKHRPNIDICYNGRDDEGNFVLYYSDEDKEEIMPEAIFDAMKDAISTEEAAQLLKQREDGIKYQSKNVQKINAKKLLEYIRSLKPNVEKHNLFLVIERLIEADDDWVSVSKDLTVCEFELKERDYENIKEARRKMANNKIAVLLKLNIVEKSGDGGAVRIIKTRLDEILGT